MSEDTHPHYIEKSTPKCTPGGLRYKTPSDYAYARDLYEEYRGEPLYEDEEVVIFIDYSGNDIPELALMTGKETVQLQGDRPANPDIRGYCRAAGSI